jgi:hypothetical protein
LDVESVVHGGVSREEFLHGAGALEARHLALALVAFARPMEISFFATFCDAPGRAIRQRNRR